MTLLLTILAGLLLAGANGRTIISREWRRSPVAGLPPTAARLGNSFVLPLLSSPIIAVVAAWTLYPLFSSLRQRFGIEQETCVCLGNEVVAVVPSPGAVIKGPDTSIAGAGVANPSLVTGLLVVGASKLGLPAR